MAKLFPVFEVPKVLERSDRNTRQTYSLCFDFEKGDFALDSSGRIKTAASYDSWVQWCLKTIYTERFAFLAYSGQAGTEIEEALKQNEKALSESYIEKTVTEALLADPYSRTVRVYDFIFNWETDSVDVDLKVSGIWDKDAALNVKLQKTR